MRHPFGIQKLNVIGGLLALLMLAASACDDPEPTATPSTVPPSTVTAEPTVTSTKDPIPTPTPLSVERVVEATAASMRALKSAHSEADITRTGRAAGEEEGTVEMSMTGDYQAPDRTRLRTRFTIEGNDFGADYITIANETYIHVLNTDIWEVTDTTDGLDLPETIRFDPEDTENLVLIGEEELDGEKVYHLKEILASDAGGLLNSVVHGSWFMVTPMGEVIVEAEFWVGVEDFLIRRIIQNTHIELSADTGERGELSLELDMRLSDYGKSMDIQAPDMESMSGTGATESQEAAPIPATATPLPVATRPPTPEITTTPATPVSTVAPTSTSTPESVPMIDLLAGLLWSYEVDSEVLPWPLIDERVLYIDANDGHVYALDASTGESLWSFETGGAVLPSTVVDGVLYAGSEDNHIYALDASSGELMRSYEVGEGMTAFLTVVGEVIYTGSEDGSVYAMDASSGEFLWNYEADGHAVLFAVMDEVVIAGVKYEFFGLDASTGELRWLYEIEGFLLSQAFPTLEGGVLYVSSGSYLEALDALTGASLWSYETGAPSRYFIPTPDVVGGVAYTVLGDGYLHALDATTGALLWRSGVPGPSDTVLFGTPKVVEGVAYVDSPDQHLNAFAASTGALLWRSAAPLSTNSLTALLAVADGVMYIVSYDVSSDSAYSRLYALEVPTGG